MKCTLKIESIGKHALSSDTYPNFNFVNFKTDSPFTIVAKLFLRVHKKRGGKEVKDWEGEGR